MQFPFKNSSADFDNRKESRAPIRIVELAIRSGRNDNDNKKKKKKNKKKKYTHKKKGKNNGGTKKAANGYGSATWTAPLKPNAVAGGGVNQGDGDLKAAAFGRRVSTSSCARKLVLNEESKRPAPTATRLTTRHDNNKRVLL